MIRHEIEDWRDIWQSLRACFSWVLVCYRSFNEIEREGRMEILDVSGSVPRERL